MIKTRTYNSCSIDNCWDEIENEAEFCYKHCKLNNIHLEKLVGKFTLLDEFGGELPYYEVVCAGCLEISDRDFINYDLLDWTNLKDIIKDIEKENK